MRCVITIKPMGKPRMTQRDVWKKRPCVMRYRAFCDDLRARVVVPDDVAQLSWIAYLPMPKSWSKKKTDVMRGQPHRQRPDRDNIDKAILDALFKDDSGVYSGHIEKRWDDGKGMRLEIEMTANKKEGEKK